MQNKEAYCNELSPETEVGDLIKTISYFLMYLPRKINQLWSWKTVEIDINVKADFSFSAS